MDLTDAALRERAYRWCGANQTTYSEWTVDELTTAFIAIHDAALAEQRERDVKMIPTNWCDPLLSGPTTTLKGNGPWYCTDIERLLSAIAAAIRAQEAGR